MRGTHKARCAVIGTILFISIIGSACGTNETAEETSSKETAAAPLTPAPPPTPPYSVVGQSNKRYDAQPIYFVLIDPVDLSTEGFKENVKLVLQAVASTDGSPDFSARVFDDPDIASKAFSQETDPESYYDDTPDESRTFEDTKSQHLVAMYAGGLETTVDPYGIDWYPGAFTGTPNVGPYVGSEVWKPEV